MQLENKMSERSLAFIHEATKDARQLAHDLYMYFSLLTINLFIDIKQL